MSSATAVTDAAEIWKEGSARHTYSLRSVSSSSFNLSDSSTASNMSRSSEQSSLATCNSISTRPSVLSHNQSAGQQRVARKNIASSLQNREEEKEDTLVSSRLRTRRRNKRFLGVRQRPSGRWVAEIKDTTQKIRLWLGTFDTAEAAARAYDEAACLLRGTNTRTNFIPHPSGKSSPIASKVAHMLQLRRNEVRRPGGTIINRQKDSFMQSDAYFNAGRISSNPRKSIVKFLRPNSANDEDISAVVALSPSITSSSLRYIEDMKSKDKTEGFNNVATLCRDEVIKNVNPEVSFCRTQPSRKSCAMPETELNFEKKAVKRAGATDKLAHKRQDCNVNCATFQNGSYLDAVLGLNDDMLASNVSALTSAVDPFYSSFYFDDEPMATTMQLPDFPPTNEFSRHDGQPCVDELSDNNQSYQVYSESVIKCMRCERSISTSPYPLNGVQDWLNQSDAILYDCLPFPSFPLSTSFQLPTSSCAYCPPFKSSVDLSCKTDQTAASAVPLSGTSPGRTSFSNTENLDPDQSQEAMWNSWDLPPLCPLSVA